MVRTALFGFVAALALAAAPATAQADGGYCGFGYGHYFGLWGNPYVYSQGAAYIPPYYAVHPPVYYSPYITARPYGSSPFAWPAAYAPPVLPAKPVMIMNAHVKDAETHVADRGFERDTSPQPVRIDNPFFVSK